MVHAWWSIFNLGYVLFRPMNMFSTKTQTKYSRPRQNRWLCNEVMSVQHFATLWMNLKSTTGNKFCQDVKIHV